MKFHCLGPIVGSRKEFHQFGIIKSSKPTGHVDKKCSTVLFGKEYFFDSALTDDSDILFELCRKCFLMLDGQISERGLRATDKTQIELRDNVTNFMNYILSFIETNLHCIDDVNKFLSDLENQLKRLRLLFHKLSLARLPDHALAYFASSLGNDCSSPALHLVHCHLDFRWLFIKIVQALEKMKDNSCGFSQFTQATKTSNFVVEEEILLLMNELVWMAIVRYEKSDKTELAPYPAFSCVCIKEMWLLLLHFNYSSQDFWVYLHQTLRIVLDNKVPPSESSTYISTKIEPPDYLPCSNRNEFALWFLADIARLLEYNCHGDYIGPSSGNSEKFEVVDDILRELLCDGAEPTEAAMRNLIPLLSKLLSACGHTRNNPIMTLWDYFFKKINSAFYIPGSKLNSNIVISKSSMALLEDVKTRLDGSIRDKRENSFLMFVRLLADYLKAGQANGISGTKILSRIVLKFPTSKPDKLKELMEQGIFHLASLYLTIAYASKTPVAINRLVELLSAIPREDGMKDGKLEMVWKAYGTSLLALEELRGDFTDSANVIINHVEWCLKKSQVAPLSHFVDALRLLFGKEVLGARGLHNLVGPWISTYLNNCRAIDSLRFMALWVPLLEQLKESGTGVCQTIRSKIEQYLVPTLSDKQNESAAELAALCARSIPRCRNELIRQWGSKEDCKLSGKFLATLVKESDALNDQNFDQLRHCVLKVWARCFHVWGPSTDSLILSKCIGLHHPTLKIKWEIDDPLKSFIEYFSIEYNLCQTLVDKSNLRTHFISFLPDFNKWLETQSTFIDTLDMEVIHRYFEYAAEFFSKCCHLIYLKSDAHCLLKVIMDTLVLPRSMYKAEYKPNSFVAASVRLHHFLRGLLDLNPEQDPYIGRLVKDLLNVYVPRMCDMSSQNHPLLNAIKATRSEYLIKILVSMIRMKNGSIPSYTPQVLDILRLAALSDLSLSSTIFSSIVESALEVVMAMSDQNPSKMAYLDLLSCTLDSMINRKHMLKYFMDTAEKHIAFNAAPWFEAVRKIAPFCRAELGPLLPYVRNIISQVEARRGVELDSSLRKLMETLEMALG